MRISPDPEKDMGSLEEISLPVERKVSGDEQRQNRDQQQLSHTDQLITRCMAVAGMYSGPILGQSMIIQKISAAWQIITAMLLTTYTVFILSVGFEGPVTWGFSFIFKMCLISFYSQGVGAAWILTYSCRSESGYRKYYSMLDKVVHSLEALDIQIGYRISLKQKLLIVSMFITIIVSESYTVYGLATSEDNIFADYRNISDSLRSAINKIGAHHHMTSISFFIMPNFYLMNMAYTLTGICDQYNQRVHAAITEDQSQFLQRLSQYRQTHVKLCDLIEYLDLKVRLLISCTLTFTVITLLIALYMMALALGPDVQMDITFFFADGFYILLCIVMLIGLIYYSHGIYSQVSVGVLPFTASILSLYPSQYQGYVGLGTGLLTRRFPGWINRRLSVCIRMPHSESYSKGSLYLISQSECVSLAKLK